ncbi:hypothetical protein [Salinactinospora qingdaonensis]|uniref:Uncharacterized protein n=1 Tax=Salinactinospora qingdaonensis TaxID=702744 RepID=A0ABP7FH44_9ACTN
MAERSVHLVGSYPASTVAGAMDTAMRGVGSHLRTLADGEVGKRSDWVVHLVEQLRNHPDVELTAEGDWSDYDNRPGFKVRKGHRFTGDSLDLGHAAQARRATGSSPSCAPSTTSPASRSKWVSPVTSRSHCSPSGRSARCAGAARSGTP